MTDVRVLMFDAHPDNCGFESSGLATLVIRAGGVVRFVSATDSSSGHHKVTSLELVECHRAETRAGAAAVGTMVTNLGFTDGWLFPDRALCEAVITAIRSFGSHVVVSPRPSDYHPDHRTITTVIQGAEYPLMVPDIVPKAPVPGTRPVILHTRDPFTDPRPFRPDIVFDIDAVLERKLDAIMAHESQVREWPPHINGFAAEVPDREPAHTEFLRRREWGKINRITVKFADELKRHHRHVPSATRAYEIFEYGAPVDTGRVHEPLGILLQVVPSCGALSLRAMEVQVEARRGGVPLALVAETVPLRVVRVPGLGGESRET